MRYCKVILKQVPTPVFAHTYQGSLCNCLLPKCENCLEISFVEKGEITVWKQGTVAYKCPEHTLSVDYNKEDVMCDSKEPWHRHITVGMEVKYEMIPVSEEEIIACSRETNLSENGQDLCAILPMDCGMKLPDSSKIPNMIREIILSYSNNSMANRLLLTAQIMKLLSEVTQECIRQSFASEKITPGNLLCVQKAMQYISENIHKKVRVEEIADAAKLSPGYLGNVFKAVTGQTLTEYVNRTKLQVVKELVLSGKMSFAQAGEHVGITDTSYLSRLFRKYLDTTIQELKRK